MRMLAIAGGVCLSLISSFASSQDRPQTSPRGGVASPLDRGYAGLTSAANSFEVLSSRMALQKSGSPAVRSFALSMTRDYRLAERKLREAATYQDYQGAAETVSTPETDASLGRLDALSGSDFDKAYVDGQVVAHAAEIQRSTDYAVQGSYGPLLGYEGSMLPHHRRAMARALAIQGAMAE